jgi:L,D-transpeptidase catalytic domain
MKRLMLFTIAVAIIFLMTSAGWYTSRLHHRTKQNVGASLTKAITGETIPAKIKTCAMAAKRYTSVNKFNTQVCFLIDMNIESGKDRFFVYDMKSDSVLTTGLVTHGSCHQNWLTGRKYGNTVGCGCTSLGKYKIGNPYYGRFGLAYKLYGLDTSNSHAYDRFVVLHSMQCVAEYEVYPYPICQSDGCPAVSPGFLKKLASMINLSSRPVLLWIVD